MIFFHHLGKIYRVEIMQLLELIYQSENVLFTSSTALGATSGNPRCNRATRQSLLDAIGWDSRAVIGPRR